MRLDLHLDAFRGLRSRLRILYTCIDCSDRDVIEELRAEVSWIDVAERHRLQKLLYVLQFLVTINTCI